MGGVVVTVVGIVGGDVVEDVFDEVGGALDKVGFDSIGKEVQRWGEDIHQVENVLSGKYASDNKKIETKAKQVQAAQARYNKGMDKLIDSMDRLLAFEEIFKIAAGNRLDKYAEQYGPEVEKLLAEYKQMVAQLKSEYDFVIGLTEGPFLQKIVGSLMMIQGGILSDVGDIISGKADGETWKRVIVTIVLVVVLVITLLAAIPTGGSSLAVTAAVLATLTTFIMLDGMYAGGAGMGAIMSVLDFVFNDALNLDDLIGNDFNKFDSDHADYQEMVMYVKLSLALAQVATSMASMPSGEVSSIGSGGGMTMEKSALGLETATPTFTETAVVQTQGSAATSYLGGAVEVGSSMKTSSLFGVKLSTYSDIYGAYSKASSVGDVMEAKGQYDSLQAKLSEDMAKLDEAIFKKFSKGFVKSYKDTAYFLQDQQEYVDRYVWSMTANNMYVDPYGTTPVANSRFTPDKDTRGLSFGFEEMFDESKMAGSKGYFNSIIYG